MNECPSGRWSTSSPAPKLRRAWPAAPETLSARTACSALRKRRPWRCALSRSLPFCRRGVLFDAVQCKIENVVIVQSAGFRTLAVRRIERPRQQEWHLLLAKTAVGTQAMSRQLTQIVVLAARSDHGVAIAESGKIALAVEGQIELFADLLLIEDQFDAGQRAGECHHGPDVSRLAQMHPHE